MDFEVLIDSSLLDAIGECEFDPHENKFLVSIINDFEEGSWRYTKFHKFVWDNAVFACLSAHERKSLVNQAYSQLVKAAQNLRLSDSANDIGEGSELAEIVLYGILQQHFGALPVVPKIFYKQNRQDNGKGADSVHIVLTHDNAFTLWLGEAKFYNSLEDSRLPKIVASIEEALRIDKLKKETSIVTNLNDLDELEIDPDLLASIKHALSGEASMDEVKARLHIPILLLHECPVTRATSVMDDGYREQIVQQHSERAKAYYQKQVDKIGGLHLYSAVTFHLILFPVPQKAAIVRTFLEHVDFYRAS